MHIDPKSIIIKKRVRQNLGDLHNLMESLKNFGQLNPIVINRRFELIAGHRRLEAAKRLGWSSINAVILDQNSEQEKLKIELEENIQRLELSPEELAEGFLRLEKLNKKSIWHRIWAFLVRWFRALFGRRR